MDGSSDQAARNRLIARAFHDCARDRAIAGLERHLSDDFELFLPGYLPWGGLFGKPHFLAILNRVANVLDFARLDFLGFVADGGHVGILIEIGIADTAKSTVISEHWDFVKDQAVRLRIAFHDPVHLLERIPTGSPCA